MQQYLHAKPSSAATKTITSAIFAQRLFIHIPLFVKHKY